MTRSTRFLMAAAAFAVAALRAQVLVPETIDSAKTALLRGHRPPVAAPQADAGPVDPTQQVAPLTLYFRRTPAQQAELERLQGALHAPAASEYHQWLSPPAFADRFGLDPASLHHVRLWLEQRGFEIRSTAASRTWISFSGTAAQVNNAFHTELRNYRVQGATHRAPAVDPSLPAEIEAVVLALAGLDDFTPLHTGGIQGNLEGTPKSSTPLQSGSSNARNSLTPADIVTIYGLGPLRAAGIDGTGQSIAIVGQAKVDTTDAANYRTKFHLPIADIQIINPPNAGASTDANDLAEASLDVELTAAAAPGAAQTYVYAKDVMDAIRYVLDNATARVLSSSYHSCESNLPTATLQALGYMGKEADLKGITWVNSSGDSGPADCDAHGVFGTLAKSSMAVNALAAVPEVTAVGGTTFDEGVDAATTNKIDWNGVNGQGFASAAGYITETAWNDSVATGGLAASGGGPSRAFPKPAWQSNRTPYDGSRDLPDVSFAASSFHDPYAVCVAGNCSAGYGGTSAGTPVMAGIVAMLNQFVPQPAPSATAATGLGSINHRLYEIAASTTDAIHDVLTGDNKVPCASGSQDCASASFGFSAGVGYDLATGLGSINATALFSAWIPGQFTSTKTTVAPGPAVAGSQTFTATVATDPTGGSPLGAVFFSAGAVSLGSAQLVAQQAGGATASVTVPAGELQPGTTTVTAWYRGTPVYAPSSGTLKFTPTPSGSKPSLQIYTFPNPVFESPSVYGNVWNFTLTVREVAGADQDLAALVALKVNSVDCLKDSADCSPGGPTAFFGLAKIPAFGSVTIPFTLAPGGPKYLVPTLVLTGYPSGRSGTPVTITLPATKPFTTVAFTIGTSTLTDYFLPTKPQSPASLQLTAAPTSLVRNPGAPANCLWSQQLLLRETAGTGVTLKHFIAGGTDMSSNLAGVWSATRIDGKAAIGLNQPLCWSGITAPALLSYSVDGVDDNGNTVSAATSVSLLNPPTTPTTIAISSTDSGGTLSLNTGGGLLTLAVTTGSAGQVWTLANFALGTEPDWLKANPVSGTGPGTVVLTPAAGLTSGKAYSATLLFQSIDSTPQVVPVSVSYTAP